MAVNNSLVPKEPQKEGITKFLSNDKVKEQIDRALGSMNSQRFITNVVSVVNNNKDLSECTNQSIFTGSLLAESLNLSLSPQLGLCYLVPFNNKKENTKVATFVLGYKGYIQLAIRSGQYKKLNVIAVKEGELKYFDPVNEDIKIEIQADDWDAREAAKTIGYYAFFELNNGFRKAIYWSKSRMINHASKYSASFSKDATAGKYPKVSFADFEAGKYPEKDAWLYSSHWYTDFDGMAYKTMLRQLISKWGIMSLDLQTAFENDTTFTDETGNTTYADSVDDVIEAEIVETTPAEETKTDSNAADALFG